MSAPTVKAVNMDFARVSADFMHISCKLTSESCDQYVEKVHETIKNLTNAFKDNDNRDLASVELLSAVCSCFMKSVSRIGCLPCRDYQRFVDLATEAARCLRNAAAGCHRNQIIITRYIVSQINSVLCTLGEQVKTIQPDLKQKVLVLIRCCVQLLGNLVTGNAETGHMICTHDLNTTLSNLYEIHDPQLSFYTCFLLHGCLLADPGHVTRVVETSGGCQVINHVLEYLSEHESEWGLYIMERLLQCGGLLPLIRPVLHTHTWNLLLDIIVTQLEKSHDQTTANEHTEHSTKLVAMESLAYLSNTFKEEAYKILGLHKAENNGDEVAVLVAKYLSVLCTATSLHGVYTELRDDQQLLQTAINLLHGMAVAGREGQNSFTPASHIKDTETTDTSDPVCGLKSDLIRLIANMVYQHRTNQNKVRELGGIQVILDHTNIDGKNPFITQWAVFAIHNLLDDNSDNQALVAGLRLTGLSHNVDQLREYGVEAELDGDNVVIRNVNKDLVSPLAKHDK